MDLQDEIQTSPPSQDDALPSGRGGEGPDEKATEVRPLGASSGDTPSATNQDLLFVTYTKPSDLESRNIKAVRSHVMRQHLRRRRTEEEELETTEQGLTGFKRQRINLLPGGRVDPFGTLSITMTRAMSRLFDHYATTLSPLHYPPTRNSVSNPMTIRWIPMAIKDSALLHSTICSAGGHLALLEGKNGPELPKIPEYLMHKTETIQLINGRMGDLPQALADETIAAIALLVTNQVVEGNYSEMRVHMQGLAKLVNMRGGLKSLGMNGLLAAEIQWCDIATSFVTSRSPLLQLNEVVDPEERFSSPQLREYFSGKVPVKQPLRVLEETSLIDVLGDNLLGAFSDMSTMTSILSLKPEMSEQDMLLYDRKRASIQHRLASLPTPHIDEAQDKSERGTEKSTYFQESCRMAGVLYSNMTLWGFQPPMYFYGDLAKILRQALLLSELELRWGGGVLEDLLIWILFIGGYSAVTRSERVWFVKQLAELVKHRRFYDTGDLKAVLVKVLYHNGLDAPLQELWREIDDVILFYRVEPISYYNNY